MQFFLNETESSTRRVALIHSRLRDIIYALQGPEDKPRSDNACDGGLAPIISGFLPQLSVNVGELSAILSETETAVDRLEMIFGLDKPPQPRAEKTR